MSIENMGLLPVAHEDFVQTEYIKYILNRASNYVKAGFAVHLRGSAGTGKTSLAIQIAKGLNRPVVMIFGNDDMGPSDLIGGYFGFRRKLVVDNFIDSVLKKEEDIYQHWVDNRITHACRYGYTLIYDEFTRSRPEANNVLLSILEEKILDFAGPKTGERMLAIHPDFRVVFTSNPEEYAGVHKFQDALLDRMITIDLGFFDKETEVAIIEAKAGLTHTDAIKLAEIIRRIRESKELDARPTIRSGIVIGKMAKNGGLTISSENQEFLQVCYDVLASHVKGINEAAIKYKFKLLLQKG